jgi:UDP-GlcNAc:undecaprenyl-phosphate GlcNAc-1-phosphate transferase
MALTPLVRRLVLRFRLLDVPTDRKVHTRAVPQLGGIAIFVAFAVAVSWGALILQTGDLAVGLGAILAAGVVVVGLGVYDDLFVASARVKLPVQILAALIVVGFGFRIVSVANPLGGVIMLTWLSVPVSVLWLVAFMNAINLIDGLDGLAAGLTAIAAATLFVGGLMVGNQFSSLLMAGLFGACIAFLYFNFHPASIFMGDTGSLFLGLVLGSVGLAGGGKSVALIVLLVPLTALGVPLIDTVMTIFRRTAKGRYVFAGDKEHIHHRLLDLGFTHRQVVIILYGLALLLGMVALALVTANRVIILLLSAAAAGFAVWGAMRLRIIGPERRNRIGSNESVVDDGDRTGPAGPPDDSSPSFATDLSATADRPAAGQPGKGTS